VDYAAKGSTVELLGKEKVGDVDAYKIKLTPKAGNEIIYFIDANTYYVIRETRKGGGMPGGGGGGARGGQANPDATFNIDFSHYQKTPDGFVFPFTVTLGNGASMNYEKIEVNKPIDEKLYKRIIKSFTFFKFRKMNIIKTSVALLLGAISFTANGQTVDDIVKKHIDAIGGTDVILQSKDHRH
jgi:hypothetical protein